jgi:DNA-binding LacI/PurR family transcriptional regulator
MNAPFHADRAEPLYQQVLEFLEEGIRNGTFPLDSLLPSEIELTKSLQVSRPTVRHALQILARQGKVKRFPGRGTVVINPASEPQRSRTFNLGLVMPELRDSFMLRIVNGIERVAAQSNYNLILTSSESQSGVEENILTNLWENQKVDGFLLMPADAPQPHPKLQEFAKMKVPIVLIDRFFEAWGFPWVCSDNVRGGYLITRHLIEHGHRRIAFITRPNSYVSSVAQRIQGYRQALEENHLEYKPGLVFQGLLPSMSEYQILGGGTQQLLEFDRKAIGEFLAHQREISAVVACNDILASHVYEVCGQLGMSIPGDLTVVGYDDTTITSLLNPPLTTIRQHASEMGKRAASMLICLLEGKPTQTEIFLPVEMVVRRSCGEHPPGEKFSIGR